MSNTPSSVKVKERVQLHLYSASGPPWPVRVETLPFLFTVTESTAVVMPQVLTLHTLLSHLTVEVFFCMKTLIKLLPLGVSLALNLQYN